MPNVDYQKNNTTFGLGVLFFYFLKEQMLRKNFYSYSQKYNSAENFSLFRKEFSNGFSDINRAETQNKGCHSDYER